MAIEDKLKYLSLTGLKEYDKLNKQYISEAYILEKDEENKKINLVFQSRGTKTVISTIDTTEFIKDGMLSTVDVVIVPDGAGEYPIGCPHIPGKYLKLVWNTDSGLEVTYIKIQDTIEEITSREIQLLFAIPVDFTPIISPSRKTVLPESLKSIVITLEKPIDSFDPENVRYVKQFGSVWFSTAGSYAISDDRLTLTLDWDFAPEIGKQYTLELPEGCIVLEDSSKNFLTNVTYNVIDVLPQDFTPVVTPASGDIENGAALKTTTMTFDSPIVSFDPENVRYAKQFGSVWLSTAGSYAISDDGLTLTLNWDFAPEVGKQYTLELPEGCIVLDNETKNLTTNIVYNVVSESSQEPQE